MQPSTTAGTIGRYPNGTSDDSAAGGQRLAAPLDIGADLPLEAPLLQPLPTSQVGGPLLVGSSDAPEFVRKGVPLGEFTPPRVATAVTAAEAVPKFAQQKLPLGKFEVPGEDVMDGPPVEDMAFVYSRASSKDIEEAPSQCGTEEKVGVNGEAVGQGVRRAGDANGTKAVAFIHVEAEAGAGVLEPRSYTAPDLISPHGSVESWGPRSLRSATDADSAEVLGSLSSEEDEHPDGLPAARGVTKKGKKVRMRSLHLTESAGNWLRSILTTSGRGSEPNTPVGSPRRGDGRSDKKQAVPRSLGPVKLPPCDKSLLDLARRISFALDKSQLDVGSKHIEMKKFSILSTIDTKERLEFSREIEKDVYCKRAMGAMVGMAVGDSVGSAFEFIPVTNKGSKFDPKTLKNTGELNKFDMKPGQWTDDTSMGLCIADSILINKTYNGSDIRVRFWNWWNRGYNNAFRLDARSKSVGLGGNVGASLWAIRSKKPPPRFEEESEDAGNGSIMRLAALPIYFFKDLDLCIRVCAESSYTTHPGHIAADACAFLGYIVARALTRPTKKESAQKFIDSVVSSYLARPEVAMQPELRKLLQSSEPPDSLERCWNWRDPKGPYLEETIQNRGEEYNGHPVNAAYMGSYSMDGLAVALHCFYHTASYLAAITKCVNLLGDADTTAAICGQMAGCFYGYDGIDWRLIQRLKQWDEGEIAFKGALTYLLGLQITDDMKNKAWERSATALAIDEAAQPPPCPSEPAGIPAIPSSMTTVVGFTQPLVVQRREPQPDANDAVTPRNLPLPQRQNAAPKPNGSCKQAAPARATKEL